MKNTATALLALTILTGCDSSSEALIAQVDQKPREAANSCVTTGPSSPIITEEGAVVVIDGKTYTAGQAGECAPASGSLSTHGAGSPIVTGAGAKVIIHVEK